MSEMDFWFVQSVTVEPYTGESINGPTYGAPQPVPCWIEDAITVVRNRDGEEEVSSATVYAALDQAALFPPMSKVTTSTRTSFVITNNTLDSGSLEFGLDHVAVSLK